MDSHFRGNDMQRDANEFRAYLPEWLYRRSWRGWRSLREGWDLIPSGLCAASRATWTHLAPLGRKRKGLIRLFSLRALPLHPCTNVSRELFNKGVIERFQLRRLIRISLLKSHKKIVDGSIEEQGGAVVQRHNRAHVKRLPCEIAVLEKDPDVALEEDKGAHHF